MRRIVKGLVLRKAFPLAEFFGNGMAQHRITRLIREVLEVRGEGDAKGRTQLSRGYRPARDSFQDEVSGADLM